MRLIGVSGLKRSGKDTTAAIIADHYGENVRRVAFARKLKLMAARSLGFWGDDDRLVALMDQLKETGVLMASTGPYPDRTGSYLTGRQYLQNLGEWARKLFGENFWVDQVLPPGHSMELMYRGVDCLVVTDCRYPNEAERIRDLGGYVIEVVRPGLVGDGHSSEEPLPRNLVDVTIFNDGTIEDLARKVASTLDEL